MPALRQSAVSLVAAPLLLILTGCQPLLTKTASPPDTEFAALQAAPPSAHSAAEPRPAQTAAEQPVRPPRDLGERLAREAGLRIPDNPSIREHRDWFRERLEHLERVERRAAPFLYFIAEEIAARGLPAELALLPVIESSFVAQATSPERAAGIWQFMPATGRQFGLRQDWWYDGRQDVIASTRAALDYLSQLRDEFDGDWTLALAAYNAGPARVRRAQGHNAAQGLGQDFWSLDLPRETQTHVPRFLALASLLQRPDSDRRLFAGIPDRPYFAVVDTGGQLDLNLAADLAGVSPEDIKGLNPGFKRWATAPDGPHQIGVPLANAGEFSINLAGLEPAKRLRWKPYTIRNGDNLGAIAQRHGITVAALKRANNLRSNRIRAGKSLLIPGAYDQGQSVAQAAAAAAAPEGVATRLIYVVRPGDTLWDIAREHGVGYRELASWNRISPLSTLRPGHKLVILVQEELAAGTARAPRARS